MFTRKYWRIRRAVVADIPQLMRVDREVWAEITPEVDFLWTAEQFKHQIEVAKCFYFVAEHRKTGEILGYVTGMPLRLPRNQLESTVTTWEKLCSGGDYDAVDHKGNAVFGVAMAVVEKARNSGIAVDLMAEEFSEAIYHGIEYGFLGGRLPGLAKWLEDHPDDTAWSYANLRRDDGKLVDPEMRLYEQDFRYVGLLPEYFPDPDSCNFGVLWEWPNPMPRWMPKLMAGILFQLTLAAIYDLPAWIKRK